MKNGGRIFFFVLFAVITGIFIGAVEVPAVRVLFLQHRAESFPVVEGRVLSGKVVVAHGSKGGTFYRLLFWYEYQVAGQRYIGQQYRYDYRPQFSKFAAAQQVVEAHPIGSEIQVYYNPADPHDAVLSPRVEGYNVGLFLMCGPICLLVLYFMIQGVQEFRRAGGVKIISRKTTTLVRLPQYDPLALSLVVSGVLSFIAGGAMMAVTQKALGIGEMMMLLIVLGGGAVYFRVWKKNSSGKQDLVIDEVARTVQLPLTYKRRKRMQYAFSEIAGVQLEKVAHRARSGVRYSYAPVLIIAGQKPQRLIDLSKRRAESFAAWLREKLGVTDDAGATLAEK